MQKQKLIAKSITILAHDSTLYAQNSQDDDDDENLVKCFWKIGFNFFTQTESVSLDLTREILMKCKELEIHSLLELMNVCIAKELRQEELILQLREAEVAISKDFKYTIEITKQRKVSLPTGHYVLNCLTCNYTCHNPCTISNDRDKYKCRVTDGGGEKIKFVLTTVFGKIMP